MSAEASGPLRIGLAELPQYAGKRIGSGDWRLVTQEHVDRFGGVTGDLQWIHVDPERAADGPFGGTIAHGFYVLALCTSFVREVFEVLDVSSIVNYGLDKVRFPAPVRVGARIRGVVEITAVEPRADGLRVVLRVTVEIEGAERPACVAELVGLYLA